MDNISFSISNLKLIKSEERGQANKILAYINGDILINSQKISSVNGLKLIYSRFHEKNIIDTPQNRGGDGRYYSNYNFSPEVEKIIETAIINAYEIKKGYG